MQFNLQEFLLLGEMLLAVPTGGVEGEPQGRSGQGKDQQGVAE